MMKLLRKHRHWLMIVIAVLAIPFVFYFVQRPDYGAMRSDPFARVYDRNVSMLEAQQMVRLLSLAEEHIEQLVRDELCLNQIKQLLAAGVSIPKGELDENFQRAYDKLYVSVIRFQPADFAKDIAPSDEDVQKYYQAHKAELKTEEKRKVEFVTLGLTDEQKKLAGKDRIDALQQLSDRATDFTQALLEKGADFKQAAAKFQLPVHETGEFTAATPDPQLKVDPQLGAAAFKLSKQEPNSDPVQVADGFYILHLAGISEARPLKIEEAKPKIVEAIKKSRARELMSTKSQDKEPKNEPADLSSIKQAVAFLNTGDVSDFFPAGESGLVAVLEKREPSAGPNAGEQKAAFERRLLDNKRRIVFYEWLRDRQQAAGLQTTKG